MRRASHPPPPDPPMLFVYAGKEKLHRYMECEVSLTACVGRIANERKV